MTRLSKRDDLVQSKAKSESFPTMKNGEGARLFFFPNSNKKKLKMPQKCFFNNILLFVLFQTTPQKKIKIKKRAFRAGPHALPDRRPSFSIPIFMHGDDLGFPSISFSICFLCSCVTLSTEESHIPKPRITEKTCRHSPISGSQGQE